MTGRKYCRICGEEVPKTYPKYMAHFLKEHSEHPLVRKWKAKAKIIHRCCECGSNFNWRKEIQMHNGEFYAPMHCPTCVEEDPVRMLFIKK